MTRIAYLLVCQDNSKGINEYIANVSMCLTFIEKAAKLCNVAGERRVLDAVYVMN